MASPSSFFFVLVLILELITATVGSPTCRSIVASDTDRIQFALNLEFLEAEFFLHGALGKGLNDIDPNLAMGGPPPIGAQKATLDYTTSQIIAEFGYEEVGHLRAITATVGGVPRPLYNLSTQNFANIFDNAVGYKLDPPFNPYLNTVNFLLASYIIPYVGLVGYVGTIPNLANYTSKALVASLLGVEAGQDAVIRSLLYERANEIVSPYGITVANFTIDLSNMRNSLAMCGNKDEGLIVPLDLGAENRTDSNILSANVDSLSFARTPQEILRIIYGTGTEYKPGGFLPDGGNGKIAQGFLNNNA
ncbi:Ferritin_2 domain-containing protein [Cephalotus follicularis]|uniref:Ferritin_2 domain-containing protein n=1 Tax=Cephalotus follicularis TaxID=3775 RepID=A0A1Q3C1E8_CEPFO|nr:Ferritin_2 domain-containing protein [Cephalotus follicularis]